MSSRFRVHGSGFTVQGSCSEFGFSVLSSWFLVPLKAAHTVPIAHRHMRTLILDDEEPIVHMLALVCEKQGHVVLDARWI